MSTNTNLRRLHFERIARANGRSATVSLEGGTTNTEQTFWACKACSYHNKLGTEPKICEICETVDTHEQKQQQQQQQHDTTPGAESFECAVCYTNGESSGIVNPKNCKHKICLACYTNIVLHAQNSEPICPECRTPFIKKSEIVEPHTESQNNGGNIDDIIYNISIQRIGNISNIIIPRYRYF
jgi:hypothetical protein